MSLNINGSINHLDPSISFDLRSNNPIIYANEELVINRVCISSGQWGAFDQQLETGVTIVEQKAKLITYFANKIIKSTSLETADKNREEENKPIAISLFPIFMNQSSFDFLAIQISPQKNYLAKVSYMTINGQEIVSSDSIHKFIVGNMATVVKVYRLLNNGAKLKLHTLDKNENRCPIWRLDCNKGQYVIVSDKENESVCVVDIVMRSKL